MSLNNKQPVILVTGANGQLGSELKELSTKLSNYQFLFTAKNELSIENKNEVKIFFENNTINYCINCAAYTAVDKAETEQEQAFLINADATGFLADACAQYHAKFIHVSTDYVYDGTNHQPLKETDAVGPVNVYGASKLKGEENVHAINPSSLIIRTSWVYSTYGNNFVKTMLRLFKEKEKLNIVNDQHGCPTYAADIANVIMNVIEGTEKGNTYSGIVNYCDAGVTTWFHFASAIHDYIKSTCIISGVPSSQYPTPAKRPQYSVLDTTKIKSMLHISIPSWKDSLHNCLKKYFELNTQQSFL